MPNTEHGKVFCVEVKPKCGFLPTSAAIHTDNSIKKRKSRFSLHQLLKHSQVSCIYRYRISVAIHIICCFPQEIVEMKFAPKVHKYSKSLKKEQL